MMYKLRMCLGIILLVTLFSVVFTQDKPQSQPAKIEKEKGNNGEKEVDEKTAKTRFWELAKKHQLEPKAFWALFHSSTRSFERLPEESWLRKLSLPPRG